MQKKFNQLSEEEFKSYYEEPLRQFITEQEGEEPSKVLWKNIQNH